MCVVAKKRLSWHALSFVIALCLVNTACTTTGSFAPDWRRSLAYESSNPVGQCLDDFRRFDRAVAQQNVKDAEAARVNGFPYLRVNRFLASFRHKDLAPAQFDVWLDSMRRLDQEARFVEAQNMLSPPVALDHLDNCAETMIQADRAQGQFAAALRRAAYVPDHYSLWKRLAGGYALTNLAAAIGYSSWKKETLDAFERFSETEWSQGPVFHPEMDGDVVVDAPGIVSSAQRNALGVPDFSRAQTRDLLLAFAPIVRVGSGQYEDQIGHPAWSHDAKSKQISIDAARPTLFGRIAYTYWNDEPSVQLVYMMWFSERPKSSAWDLLGGSLDGLIWRVTLNNQGQPVVYDSIHLCGCYHLFFPAPSVDPKPVPEESDLRESILVPARAPDVPPGQRLELTLEPGSHYLVSVAVASQGKTGQAKTAYRILTGDQVPDQNLRLLPLPNGLATRSIYGEDGLIRQSQRLERWVLWPMGIESAGAMRQWGTHATAFVGKRHYDDPYLMDNSFE